MLLYSRRKFLTLLAVPPLAACGFQPIYKDGSDARGLHGQMQFNLIDSREGFVLLEALETRLGIGGANAPYAVDVELQIEEDDLVLRVPVGVITLLTRYTLNGTANIKVTRRDTGDRIFSDRLQDTISYSGSEDTLMSSSSKQDAYDKLVTTLADKIVLRLSSTAESWAG